MKISKDKKGRWIVDFTCKGRRITRVVGSSRRQAEAKAAMIKADILRDPYDFGRKKPEILFEDQAKEYMELYSKQNNKSWSSDEYSLNHLKEFFKGKNLSEITPDLIEKYRLKRKADGKEIDLEGVGLRRADDGLIEARFPGGEWRGLHDLEIGDHRIIADVLSRAVKG